LDFGFGHSFDIWIFVHLAVAFFKDWCLVRHYSYRPLMIYLTMEIYSLFSLQIPCECVKSM